VQVFNGICGAESGQVPVSAVAPAMLFSQLEVQKHARGADRPPILPAPGTGDSASFSLFPKFAPAPGAKP
jgi:TldD protein